MVHLISKYPRGARWMDSRIGEKPLLVCFPFAGGGASIFSGWKHALSEYVEVSPIYLPGREVRSNEPPISNMVTLISELVSYCKVFDFTPDVVFGHSMGAALGYELCAGLQSNDLPVPKLLILSGHASPESRIINSFHHLEDSAFIKSIYSLGSLDLEITKSPELIAYLLPILRADFTLIETWKPSEVILSNTNILTISGEQDESASLKKMIGWNKYTSCQVDSITIRGNHFFIQQQRSELISLLKTKLENYFN